MQPVQALPESGYTKPAANPELPRLDDKIRRNIHLLLAAQVDANSRRPAEFLERDYAAKIPVRFDADAQGNLVRVGGWGSFFRGVANRWSNGSTIDAMNDRVRGVLSDNLQAILDYVTALKQFADSVVNPQEREGLPRTIESALCVWPRNDFKNVPERISSLNLAVLGAKGILDDDEWFTSFSRHSTQHSPFPPNFKELEDSIIVKIAGIYALFGIEVHEAERTRADLAGVRVQEM